MTPASDSHTVDLTTLRQALLTWFTESARELPWRRSRDPYRILVAEVMLQQTQVDRVIPKYLAFLESFPTIEALAAAPTAAVIRAWSGLGYNRRAVNMQRTARVVLEQYDGRFPQDMASLRRLPGIGPYTAGAIACFAFEQDVAFLDTNIRRVIRRVFGGPAEGGAASEAQLLMLAQAAIPHGGGWMWNQAIMELGALICTAATPACWRCPLRDACQDYRARRQQDEQLFQAAAAPGDSRRQRQVAEPRETPYAGSSRFYRGRIIETLRQMPAGKSLALNLLGQQVKADFGDTDRAWLQRLVESLARDGLLLIDGEAARLPE